MKRHYHRRLRTSVSVLGFLAAFVATAGWAQSTDASKLHPRARALFRPGSVAPGQAAPGLTERERRRIPQPLERRPDGTDVYGIVVHTDDPGAIVNEGITVQSVFPGFVTARLTAGQVALLAGMDQVRYLDAPGADMPHNDVASGLVGARLLNDGYIRDTLYQGEGVLVGIYDTGIDWEHLDFRDPDDTTVSRIVSLWDQTITVVSGESAPSGFSYGVEYTRTHIENELDGSPAGFVRTEDINGHGTHVAGTAAGNGAALAGRKYAGMAPGADLVIVKGGDASFPQTNVIDGLTYFQNVAALQGRPIVVNMSLGSVAGAHDGTDAKSVAMNSFADVGRVLVVSAGNSGADLIHVSGSVSASDSAEITFTIPSYTPIAGAFNDDVIFDIWFSGNSAIDAHVITPNSHAVLQNAGGETTLNTPDGTVNVINEIIADNDNRQIFVDIYDEDAEVQPASGTWTIRFTNGTDTAVTYHGWVIDHRIGALNTVVTPTGADANYTLANSAEEAIIVGSYVHRWRWFSEPDDVAYSYGTPDRSDNISSFSSIGPTRTGSQKPDLAAPGQAMISARSADAPVADVNIVAGGKHLVNQGTSMSSPVVAGSVALLLQEQPTLSAATVASLLKTTAYADTSTAEGLPDDTWGYGKLDIFRAMQKLINSSFPRARTIVAYDSWSGSGSSSLGANDKAAVRFTPAEDGNVVGAFVHLGNTVGVTSSLVAEVWSDNGLGSPSSLLGTAASLPADETAKYTWSYIPFSAGDVSVNAGQNYHLVVSFTSGTTTDLLVDSGSVDGRSSLYTGSVWNSQSFDYRIRPVVANDVTGLPVEMTAFTGRSSGSDVQLRWTTATETANVGWEVERRNVRFMEDGPGETSWGEKDGEGVMVSSIPGSRATDSWKPVGFVDGAGTSSSPREYEYLDRALAPGRYAYRLKQVDVGGGYHYSGSVEVTVGLPAEFALSDPYPNPFNPEVSLDVSLPVPARVRLQVFDILGRQVAIVGEGEWMEGVHRVRFSGEGLASGVYFCRLEGRALDGRMFYAMKKMALVR